MGKGANRARKGAGAHKGNPLKAAVVQRDRDTLTMVSNALRHREAMLAFQPVVLGSDPARVGFYEGLIRVLDATGRIIPARDFMPVVEDKELGREIDCVALELGLQALEAEPTLRLSINMSARSIGYGNWMRILDTGLARNPHLGERLILEITESSAMTMPELVTSFMADLQDRGICFALDDFGAGYTALRYLKEFYFDILKIDGQFVRGIHRDPDNQVLVEAMITIGRQFDMLTVAEMVEGPKDARFLIDVGIDCLQGYHFGAPTVHPPWRAQYEDRASA